jgi:hypothetical protein
LVHEKLEGKKEYLTDVKTAKSKDIGEIREPEKAVVGGQHVPVEGYNFGIFMVCQNVIEGQIPNLNDENE